MHEALAALPESVRDQLREADPPDWMAPMLATLTDECFSDDAWIFERKLDGERGLVFKTSGHVRLLSRNTTCLNDTYPELVDALDTLGSGPFIADGEIVAFSRGVTSFARLQQRMQIDDPDQTHKSGVAVYYYLFDLLHLGGYNLTHVPLRHQKSALKRAFDFSDPLRFLPHRNAEGESIFQEACEKGWEGIIAKKATSRYVHHRSTDWLKFKCINEQELVIGGFTEPHGKRVGFGALLLGYYEGEDLRYAGKVGTGFDKDTLHDLRDRFADLERDTPPFAEDNLPRKEVYWLEPRLVAEIGFEEWTEDGRLRQPRFLGLRRDKDPEDVTREESQ